MSRRLLRSALRYALAGLAAVADGCGRGPSLRLVDVQQMHVVTVDAGAVPGATRAADLVILGGGMGGTAAALAATDAGQTVVLVEETAWVGGQATSQGVSALDENPYIERSGGTRSYLEFRARIRDGYRRNTRLTRKAAADPLLDPGNSWVSALTFEPKRAVSVIDDLLRPACEAGRLTILRRHRIVRGHRAGREIEWVDVVDLESGRLARLVGRYYLDATELGDPLVACDVGHVVGAESRAQTGEPDARADGPHPECVQSFTYPFALRRMPAAARPVVRPADYAVNVDRQPYTLRHLYPAPRGWVRYGMFENVQGSYGPFWTYRRLIDRGNFEDPAYAEDVAMINWPGNDYRRRSLLTDSPRETLEALREAKSLALGFCHWLQTECPRDEGGTGYPELMLDPAVMGTADGLSMFPYIRESRRIQAVCTIVEQDVAAPFHPGRVRSRHFEDSVGIGWYGIDIHANDAERKIPSSATLPFQIPLGSLIPRDTDNLLAAGKTLGTTHITNGCYRLHPVEWNVGEAAAMLAVECLRTGMRPQELRNHPPRVRELQRRLVERGVPIFWYDDTGPGDAEFARAQLAPFTQAAELERLATTLHFRAAKDPG